jgi:signal transduction histidine kinase
VLLALAAVIAGLVEREVLRVRLFDRVEEQLAQELQELERLAAAGRDAATGRPFSSPAALFDAFADRNVPDNEEATVAFVDGRLHAADTAHFPLTAVPAAALASWAALARGPPRGGGTVTGRYDTPLGEARFSAARYRVGEGAPGLFVVTVLPAGELREIEELRTYGVLAMLVGLLACSGVGWVIASRVLRPVRALTETARSISQSDLTRRVEVRGADEAAEMARSFNAMLDRVEGLFRGQRQFVQDASHELRDPLTVCRGHLELLPADPEERRATIALVTDELARMGRIVGDLQLLADREQPDFLRPEPIDLELFAHEVTAKVSALAPRRWRLDGLARGTFVADRDRLTEAVMNLAHNAVQHTDRDDEVAIGIACDHAGLRLWVRDSGCGVTAADQARILDRFTRGGSAHRRYRGSGLGLAIVDAIAQAHGGHVEIASRVGSGTTVAIVIPRREEAADGAPADRRG